MKANALCIVLAFLLQPFGLAVAAEESILVTAISGSVTRSDGQPLQLLAHLRQGDKLALAPGAKVRLLYGKSGRQEAWSGNGQMEITANAGRSSNLPEAQVSSLPPPVVSQIMKTPVLDAQGEPKIPRLRAIPTPDALARLEKEYWRLRTDATSGDMNPELFLLSGLLEMRETKRLEEVLSLIPTLHPDNMEAKLVVSLYKKSLKNLKEAGR